MQTCTMLKRVRVMAFDKQDIFFLRNEVMNQAMNHSCHPCLHCMTEFDAHLMNRLN